jgi:SnoaL-like protein
MEAFNEHEFKKAFSSFPDDFEWRFFPNAPERVAYGAHAITDVFERLVIELPDWRSEPQEFIQADERTIMVRIVGTATGRQSGVTTEREFTQVWDLGEDGLPVRVREYEHHEDAVAAAARRDEA